MRRVLFVIFAIGIGLTTFGDEPQTVMAVHIVAPQYPAIAKTAHVSGDVKVDVTISEDGTVKDATAVDGPPLLRRACQDAVRQWKFATPPSASMVDSAYCVFKLNDTAKNVAALTSVTFDMPNRVTVVDTPPFLQTQTTAR
jgi:TonB family protein